MPHRLAFMLELPVALGVDVPESAYREVATVDGCISYLVGDNARPQAVKPADR
jgi:hypothetical protein